MKIFIICSKKFYDRIDSIKEELKGNGHELFMPNCYDAPDTEDKMRQLGRKEYQEFKAEMYKQSENIIKDMDAVLVLNFDKESDGKIYKNYIGGATFLEMYDAFRMGKQIYMMNGLPDGILKDEIEGFNPIIINGNLNLIGCDSNLNNI